MDLAALTDVERDSLRSFEVIKVSCVGATSRVEGRCCIRISSLRKEIATCWDSELLPTSFVAESVVVNDITHIPASSLRSCTIIFVR